VKFRCSICRDIYLDLAGQAGEAIGVCEPCSRRLLGDAGFEAAVQRAADTVHRLRARLNLRRGNDELENSRR
jgi:hypothetical protein